MKQKIKAILFNNARHDDLSGIIIVSRINDDVFEKIAQEIINLDNWISVEDELPKHLTKVLGYNDLGEKFGHIDIVCYDERDKSFSPFYDELCELENVTHWQEIQPPKQSTKKRGGCNP